MCGDIEASRELLRCQLDCAKKLGASGILTVPGGISDTVSIKRAYSLCIETLASLAPEIADDGLYSAHIMPIVRK